MAKAIEKLKAIAKERSSAQSLKKWAESGGDVPVRYKGREHVWNKKVEKFAAGGEAQMQAGGFAKLAKKAIGAASESAGMKAPVTATKDLTTLQDFHTSLGDRIRQRAAETQKMMDEWEYKYKPGQHVFTEDSAKKNLPPMRILDRARSGYQVMREDMSDPFSKKIIDPATGRAKRTPYEPGYRVRMERGPDDWSEFIIPEKSIAGDVGMQAGGVAKLAKALKGAKEAPAAAETKIIQAPTVIVPSKLSNVKEAVRQSKGDYGARRVERAADEIPNLERMYKEEGLRSAFTGDNAQALMTMNPADFEKFALPLVKSKGARSPMSSSGEVDKYTLPTDEYVQYLQGLRGGFSDVPFLGINKEEYGLPLKPFISGHEGRHRSRALAQSGQPTSLVRLVPRAELREPFPRRTQEEYIQALRDELDLTGNLVMPEGNAGSAIVLPDIYAKGGEVHKAKGGEVEDKAYVGYRRAGRRPESQQNREASANIPVAVARGLVSGTLGMPGDLESLARLPYELITGNESPTILPTSGDIEKRLPLRGASQTPAGELFTGAGQLAGGFYTGPGSGARAVMAVPKALKRAGQDFVVAAGNPAVSMASRKGITPIVVRTPEERAVLEKFGQKQTQEAARQKKVEKLAQESAGQSPEAQAAKPAKSKGPRTKVEADIYRKMAEDKGDAEVLRVARAGEHLKPTSTGYVGAPRTVTGPQALGAMRRAMDKDFADSVQAVRLADPDRLGTWYDRAKQGISESSEPYQLPRTLEQHGVYSAGVSPESELAFSLKHLNSRVAGDPQMAYRGAGMRNLDTAVAENRPANMGFKIGEYANKNDPRIPNEGLFGVNDFRRAQGMGYTDPAGNPWKAGVSETMHPFMDAETALQVDRANRGAIGGRTDWAGPHIQEVPWVYGKAQDLYGRGKKGRYAGDELEGIKMSLQDANNTARDYFYKHAASATHEAIPGASLGHVRQALDMTPEQKLAYGRQGRWDMPPPEYALSDMGEVGAGNRDIIYGALGYRQLPSREASGLYMNKLGGVETNPMTIARPLMDFPTGGGGGRMAEDSSRMMDTSEQFRALMDAQEAGAYNLPNTMASVKGKNSLVLDTRGRFADPLSDPSAGVLPTSEQLARMGEIMGDYGFGVTATNRGAVAFPFDSAMDPKAASSAFRKTSKKMQEVFPSSQEKAITSTGYVPGVGKRSPDGPLSTAPYSGEATSDMLRAFSELPQSVSLNLSESEAVREAIRAKALRDSKMGGTRGDIQETRRFFSEADWPRAVEMIRRGMTPAAALAALGYSASSMAQEAP
jgi:hypothetical protein